MINEFIHFNRILKIVFYLFISFQYCTEEAAPNMEEKMKNKNDFFLCRNKESQLS